MIVVNWWETLGSETLGKLQLFTSGEGGHGYGGPLELSVAAVFAPASVVPGRAPDLPATEGVGREFPYFMDKSGAPGWKAYSGKLSEISREKSDKLAGIVVDRISALVEIWLRSDTVRTGDSRARQCRLKSMRLAITRKVSPEIGRCELTHLERSPMNFARAAKQHEDYETCLRSLGCEVHSLAAEPSLPDSVFVEDAAVVLDEIAVLCRPGAQSRRNEVASIAQALRPYRTIVHIEPPGTLEGGDVLRIGKTVFVGLSRRSNSAGCDQLRGLLEPYGYSVQAIAVEKCLHLKSAVTQVGDHDLLINPAWAEERAFKAFELIEVDPGEPFAANALLLGEHVIYPAAYARTRRRLEERGIAVVPVQVDELAKAEGGVTCCSLILKVH